MCTIVAVAEVGLSICDLSNYRDLLLLYEHVPVLAAFLTVLKMMESYHKRDFIKLLLYLVQAPFIGCPPIKCHGDARYKLMRNCTHLRLTAVKMPRMVIQLFIQTYLHYAVSMECAMGLRCCRPVSL